MTWLAEPWTAGHSIVHPVDDLIEHDVTSEECVCGPTSEAVRHDDGSVGWVLVHHSLDGRENHE